MRFIAVRLHHASLSHFQKGVAIYMQLSVCWNLFLSTLSNEHRMFLSRVSSKHLFFFHKQVFPYFSPLFVEPPFFAPNKRHEHIRLHSFISSILSFLFPPLSSYIEYLVPSGYGWLEKNHEEFSLFFLPGERLLIMGRRRRRRKKEGEEEEEEEEEEERNVEKRLCEEGMTTVKRLQNWSCLDHQWAP